ncbi:hypothetical protein MB901379_00051 [Mycobacterium basiliense]|uniref:Vegetative cell wall protein gp1 n=1 Tax=Mycobacterium basiliense TaxID=2094119 RepID=A0A3S4FMI0_9MYCO|nr:hypothetical protein MB901379_00051 [Mycobacterium basiliense]
MIGGLWPAELSPNIAETATLAEYLQADLQRIVSVANEELRNIRQSVLIDSARREAEARVIDEARVLAVRRVDSTLRQLRERERSGQQGNPALERTQVLPAVRDEEPAVEPATVSIDEDVGEPATESERGIAEKEPRPPVQAADAQESEGERLRRLLTFVARQEPRLRWAVGQLEDGAVVLATDLAHGWIPPGIMVPEGVRLLPPGQRSRRGTALLGVTARTVTYSPGDSLAWTERPTATRSSVRPRELPNLENLEQKLSDATLARAELPRVVHILAKAAAAGTHVAEDEIDLVRVHLDTAQHETLAQYPGVDVPLLLNCMLLAAIESSVTGDAMSANYHFSWFRAFDQPPVT